MLILILKSVMNYIQMPINTTYCLKIGNTQLTLKETMFPYLFVDNKP